MNRPRSHTRMTFTNYGGPNPYVGEYLLTTSKRTAFLIMECRPIKRRTPGPPKFAITALRVPPTEVIDPTIMQWEPRSRRGPLPANSANL